MKNTTRMFVSAMVGAMLSMTVAPTAIAATLDITVANTAPREITGLYFAATVTAKWGPDQLNGMTLVQGSSWTLQGVSCDQPSITLVAEDEAGCFAYQAIACSSGGTWTITGSTVRDCGR